MYILHHNGPPLYISIVICPIIFCSVCFLVCQIHRCHGYTCTIYIYTHYIHTAAPKIRNMSFADTLSKYNDSIVESWPDRVTATPLPANVFQAWLYEIDPTTECTVTLQLNTSHLVGLLICRELALISNGNITGDCSTVHTVAGFEFQLSVDTNTDPLLSKLVLHSCAEWRQMTLRQLRDAIQNLQANWITGNASCIPALLPYVNQLFTHFGNLSMQHGMIEKDMDDQVSAMLNVCMF
jgi:hypothetical protein